MNILLQTWFLCLTDLKNELVEIMNKKNIIH